MTDAWRLLLRGARTSFDPRRWILAAAGLLLLWLGLAVLDRAFSGSPPMAPSLVPSAPVGWEEAPGLDSLWKLTGLALPRLAEPFLTLAAPVFALFDHARTAGGILHALLAVVWTAVVWGIAGGAIARTTLMELSDNDEPGLLGPLRFAARFAFPLIVVPLTPLLLMGLLGLVCAAVGLLEWLPGGIGPALGRVLFCIPLVLGFAMAILRLGMLAAWPLWHASIAAECDHPGAALGRVLAYLNRRPGAFVVLVLQSGLIGLFALVVAMALFRAAPELAAWGIGLTAPGPAVVPPFWQSVAELVERSWIFAYFWTQAATIHVLLRQNVEGTPWETVSRHCEPG